MIRTMRHLINLLMRRIRAYLYTPKARKGWNIFYTGELAEWSNAAVLKTVDCNRSGGSNPSLSASFIYKSITYENGIFLTYTRYGG